MPTATCQHEVKSRGAVRAVLFDFGDTLVSYPLHSRESQLRFIGRFLEELDATEPGFPALPLPVDEFAARLNRENADHSVWPLQERLRSEGLYGARLSESQAALFEGRIVREVCREAKIFEDAAEVVAGLRSRGLKVALVSNLPWGTSTRAWLGEFARHGFGPSSVDAAVTCMDAGVRKPDPAAIRLALGKLGVGESEAVFVGDNPRADMPAAAAAGCVGILLNRSGAPCDYPGPVIRSLRELPGLLWRDRERDLG